MYLAPISDNVAQFLLDGFAWRIVPLDEFEVFSTALEIVSPQDRARFLGQACGDDGTFRQRIETLLESWREADTFLTSPAPNLGPLLHENVDHSPGYHPAASATIPRRVVRVVGTLRKGFNHK